ncbi:MAG TPA: zinc ABC transporter substrate-binding protein [Gammaproteobacteria bacterium]|nr:zinc ABC transporter substrate-binding protein [Gammaproteobacteria bacterium]
MPVSRSLPRLSALLFLLFLSAAAHAAVERPRVTVSIQPIHSLVAGVMSGIGEPRLLVKGYGSPHAYQMRPSDAAALYQADLVFWMGVPLENFLVKPLQNVRPPARVLTLLDLEGLDLLENRGSGVWHPHQREAHDAGEPASHAQSRDPHAWLSPAISRRMVKAIASELVRADPRNAQSYRRNALDLDQRIAALATELEARLAPVRHVPFVMFHDAFQYFEQAFGLRSIGAMQLEPSRVPGAARIQALRDAIRNRGVRCVFREPQFQSALVDTLVEKTDARVAVLDPLGAAFTPGPDAWFQMMTANAEAMEKCLGQ